MLTRALASHPEISGFSGTGVPEDEGQHLQSVMKPSGAHGGAGRFAFDPEAHLTEDSSLVTSANRDRLFSEWSSEWDLNRPVLLEKSPPNLVRSRFLQAMFPNSYFVFLLRHPVAVSYATHRWYGRRGVYRRSLASLLRHWTTAHHLMSIDRIRLDRSIDVRYENFVRDPEATLDRIYRFIDLPSFPPRVEVRDSNGTYFDRWRRRESTPVIGAHVPRMVERMESEVRGYGYSLKDLTRVTDES